MDRTRVSIQVASSTVLQYIQMYTVLRRCSDKSHSIVTAQ